MGIESFLAVGGAVITVITSVVLLKTKLDAMEQFEEEARKGFEKFNRVSLRLSDLEKKFDAHKKGL